MDFFSLGESFITFGMGLGLGEISFNTFGNKAHPSVFITSKNVVLSLLKKVLCILKFIKPKRAIKLASFGVNFVHYAEESFLCTLGN